jgi:predicted NBD/HSP70 family sugar kinase
MANAVGDFGYQPIVPPRLVGNVPRLPDAMVERFRAFPVPDLSDAVGQQGSKAGRSPLLAERLLSNGTLSARDVAESAQHGDRAGVEIIRGSERLIGRVPAGTVNFFNPSLIVVSGGVCGLGFARFGPSLARPFLPLRSFLRPAVSRLWASPTPAGRLTRA